MFRLVVACFTVATIAALASPASAEEDVPMDSPGLVAGGVALTTVGAVGAGFGGFLIFGVGCSADTLPGQDAGDCALPYRAGGTALALAGLGGIAGGIAMMVIGARDEQPAAQLSLGLGGLTLTGSF
jgi:hypothetical protein